MTPSLERLAAKAKEVPSSHKVRLAPLDTNLVFQCLRVKKKNRKKIFKKNKKISSTTKKHAPKIEVYEN